MKVKGDRIKIVCIVFNWIDWCINNDYIDFVLINLLWFVILCVYIYEKKWIGICI